MMKGLSLFKKCVYAAVIVGILFTGYKLIRNTGRSSSGLPDLFSENIQDRFYAYATKITGKQSLYVAKLNQMEVFERTSEAKALWFALPSIVVKAEVPVEYNYYVNLTSGWRFEVIENVLHVFIPELTNSTPAINIAKLKVGVAKGSLLRNETDVVKRFEQELPGLLVERGIEHRNLVREQARASVEGFVKAWIESFVSRKGTAYKIQVLFPGEKPAQNTESQIK
ncbi:hypothetical protein QJS83_10885 [Bdellovibrio sp. 22V]|uniref:hypothetical protein n=1 Tax=Bdellovibrio sp. 22V TaxID=3044166 RepID=UPI0025433D57|nr:hypothetical protein [Bdellovibrio sp. 22V]WII70965.1 hypothetical protein QJS83_10885 [Bdellovibrio sp. 22V]